MVEAEGLVVRRLSRQRHSATSPHVRGGGRRDQQQAAVSSMGSGSVKPTDRKSAVGMLEAEGQQGACGGLFVFGCMR